MSEKNLRRVDVSSLPVDGSAPRLIVEITEAAATHVAAWDVDQKVKCVHEAVHTVIGHSLGIRVKAVDVTGRHGGHTETGLGDDDLPDTQTAQGTLDEIVMVLAAAAGERMIFGQETMGVAADLSQATSLAYRRLNAGLDQNAPLFSTDGVPYNLMPAAIVDEFGRAVVKTLAEARERGDALVMLHRDAILSFAARLYDRRRLSGPELEELLAALNLRP